MTTISAFATVKVTTAVAILLQLTALLSMVISWVSGRLHYLINSDIARKVRFDLIAKIQEGGRGGDSLYFTGETSLQLVSPARD